MKLLIVNLAVVLLVAVVGLSDAQKNAQPTNPPITQKPLGPIGHLDHTPPNNKTTPNTKPHTIKPVIVPAPNPRAPTMNTVSLDLKDRQIIKNIESQINHFYPEIRKHSPQLKNLLKLKLKNIKSATKTNGKMMPNRDEYRVRFIGESTQPGVLRQASNDKELLYLSKYEIDLVFSFFVDGSHPRRLMSVEFKNIPYGAPYGDVKALPIRALNLTNPETRAYIVQLVDQFVPDYRKRSRLAFLDSVERFGQLNRADEVLDLKRTYDFLDGKDFFRVSFNLYALPLSKYDLLIRPANSPRFTLTPPALYNVNILVSRSHSYDSLDYKYHLVNFNYKRV